MSRATRNRPSKICLFCRKRKKKCTREIPCQECLRANVKCEYPNLNISKKTKSQESQNSLNGTVIDIYQNKLSNRRLTNNETMHNIPKFNIYKKYSSINIRQSRQINYGPFSWISLMKSDPILSSLEQYVLSNFFDLQEVKSKSFLDKNHNEQLPQDLKNIVHPEEEESQANKELIPNIENFSLTEFTRELANALPLFEMTWDLINIFFKSIYPILPIIDESLFKNNIQRILVRQEEIDGTKWKINITKNTDITVIGILLIVMRISFSFQYEGSPLQCFKGVIDGKTPRWIHEVEVLKSYRHILLAKKCISHFSISRKSSIEVLQLLMVYKFYHKYSPEKSDGVDECDSELTLASMIQLAISLGVNREPTLVPNFKDDEKFCHLIRKLWYILVIWDIHETCVSGGFFIIDSSHYDVEFPRLSNEATNSLDINLEKSSVDILGLLYLQVFPLKHILISLIDIRIKSSVEEILVLISEIESSHLYSPLKINSEIDKLDNVSDVKLIRSVKTMIYFEIKSCLMCINYLLFLHCEEAKSERMCHFFMKKTLSIITFDLIVGFYSILFSNRLIDYFVIPSVECSIQKVNVILLSFIIRAKYLGSENNPAEDEYKNNMRGLRFFNSLQACSSLCISLGSLLSSWYCYSLQIVKAHKYLYNLVFDTGFTSDMNITCSRINLSLIESCSSLCENGIKQVESMLPDILSSNINLFNESYLSDGDQRVENDVLRSALIKYYRDNTNIGVRARYSGYYKYVHSDAIIPKHWIDVETYPRPLRHSSLLDENIGIRDDFLDYLQNPKGNFDFNFDDIFYNFQNFQ